MTAARFRTSPRPNSEVIGLLERLLAAARQGQVASVGVVVVNPLNQIETDAAGDLTELRTNALICGHAKAGNKLLSK